MATPGGIALLLSVQGNSRATARKIRDLASESAVFAAPDFTGV
ncbi:hypothetical protein [Accumulibacter sp.]|nr:hypothetical protein [Accumulibacter sp.]